MLRWWCGLSAAALVLGGLAGARVAGAVEVAVTAAAAVGVRWSLRRYRPRWARAWHLLSAALVAFTVADLIAELWRLLSSTPPSYPGPGDLANLVGYLLCIAAGLAVVRDRSGGPDSTSLIDAGIVSGGIGTLAWVFVIVPDLQSRSSSGLGKGADVVFDLLSLVLVAIIARLAIGPGTRNASWHWLAGAVGAAMASDLLLAVSNGSRTTGLLVLLGNALAAGSVACVAAAALEPTMAELTQPAAEGVARLSRPRLVTMTAAVLVAPAILLWRSGGPSLIFTVGAVVCWAGVSVLVLARLAGLVRAREQMARIGTTLGRAGSAMAGASEWPKVIEAAARAVRELVAVSGVPGRAGVAVLRGDDLSVALGVAHEPIPDAAPVVRLAALREAVLGSDPVELPDPLGLPAAIAGRWVAVFPVAASHGDFHGALVVCADTRLRSLFRGACESLAHLLSLSLDSAAATALEHQQAAERRFQKLFEHSADIVAVLGADGRSQFLSPSATHLLGLDPGDTHALDLRGLVHDDDRESYDRLVCEATIDGSRPVEIRLKHSDGTWRWFDVVARDLRSVPDVASAVITARHITDRKVAEQDLARSERRFRSLVHNSSDVIAIIDGAGSVNWVSDSVSGVLGIGPGAIRGKDLLDVVDSASAPRLRRALTEIQDAVVSQCQVEAGIRDSTGELRTFELTLTDRRWDPAVQAVVCNARDVTEQKVAEAGLRHQALHDHLTGLANRVLLRDRVKHALGRRPRERGVLGLLFIDLDDFKTVNDSLGHAVGDELLARVATRIGNCCRSEDTAARLGGDEFAILVESAGSEEEILSVANRLLTVLKTPVVVGRRTLTVAASIGVATAATDATTSPDDLLRDADAAMYVAKGRGKNRVELFTPEMHLQAFDRLELKEDLVGATTRGEMRLHYQPIVDLSSGALAGYEALLRWQHPTRGLLAPDAFVGLAEETGLIVGLGRWAFDGAIAEQARWRGAGHDLLVAVNMSPRQLESPTLLGEIGETLARHGSPPERVTIELTESFEVTAATAARLDELRALGVRIAADDFGAGAASYAALQHLPFTTIKVDKSLIDGIADRRGQAQVRSIIEMAHASGLRVVAEGVDATAQATALLGLGCDYGQGFLFGRPAPPSELLHLDETLVEVPGRLGVR